MCCALSQRSFYIILSGKVSIYINTDVVPDDPSERQAPVAGAGGEAVAPAEKQKLDRTKFGNFIAPLGTPLTSASLCVGA